MQIANGQTFFFSDRFFASLASLAHTPIVLSEQSASRYESDPWPLLRSMWRCLEPRAQRSDSLLDSIMPGSTFRLHLPERGGCAGLGGGIRHLDAANALAPSEPRFISENPSTLQSKAWYMTNALFAFSRSQQPSLNILKRTPVISPAPSNSQLIFHVACRVATKRALGSSIRALVID